MAIFAAGTRGIDMTRVFESMNAQAALSDLAGLSPDGLEQVWQVAPGRWMDWQVSLDFDYSGSLITLEFGFERIALLTGDDPADPFLWEIRDAPFPKTFELAEFESLSGRQLARFFMRGDDEVIGHPRRADTLLGGAGADHFVFEGAPRRAAADVIRDFSHAQHDKIVLDDAAFSRIGSHLSSKEFLAATDISASGGADTRAQHILYDSDSGRLYYDVDGSGTAHDPVLIATLSGHPVLAAGDFLVG